MGQGGTVAGMSVSTVYDDVNHSVYEPDEVEVASSKAAKRALSATDGTSAKRPCAAAETENTLQRQVEYYLSDENLSSDTFFHDKISADPDGWLDAEHILGCPKVQKMGATEADIESALMDSSELETRRVVYEDDEEDLADIGTEEEASILQVRRKGGKPLPLLFGGQPAGWLAAKIAARRRGSVNEAPAASAPEEKTAASTEPSAQPLAAGMQVSVQSGEYAGQTGSVMAIDGDEVTLMIDGEVACVEKSEVKAV